MIRSPMHPVAGCAAIAVVGLWSAAAHATGAGALGIVAAALQIGACVFVFLLGLGLILVPPNRRLVFVGVLIAASAMVVHGGRYLWAMPAIPAVAAIALYVKTRRALWLTIAIAASAMCIAVLLPWTSVRASQALMVLLVASPGPVLLWVERRKRDAVIMALVSVAFCVAAPMMLMSRYSDGRWYLGWAALILGCTPATVFVWRLGKPKVAVAVGLLLLILLEGWMHLL